MNESFQDFLKAKMVIFKMVMERNITTGTLRMRRFKGSRITSRTLKTK
jgi:hypothetical protein